MSGARTTRQLVIATWAASGVALLFLEAVARMGVRTVRMLREGVDGSTWLWLALVVALFCYGEGYRALQKRFVPHVVARAMSFGESASGCLTVLSAPLYAMSLVGCDRRELLRGWLGVGLIVGAIVVVRALPSPWRAVVDAGVTAALAWGLVALISQFVRAIAGHRMGAVRVLRRA